MCVVVFWLVDDYVGCVCYCFVGWCVVEVVWCVVVGVGNLELC